VAKIKKVKPSLVKFFIADDIRLEGGDSPKPTMLGMYADNVIVVQMPEDQPDPTEEAPIAIEGIAILAAFYGGAGTFDGMVSLKLPSGDPLIVNSPTGPMEARKGSAMLFVAKLHPFRVPEFGLYYFSIALDNTAYDFEFELRRGAAPNRSLTQQNVPKKQRSKRAPTKANA